MSSPWTYKSRSFFRFLYGRFSNKLLDFHNRRRLQRAYVEDVVQETLVSCAVAYCNGKIECLAGKNRKKDWRRNVRDLECYVFGVTINKTYENGKEYRRRKPPHLQLDPALDKPSDRTNDQPADHVVRVEHDKIIRQVLDELPPSHRNAIELKYFRGFTLEEVAQAMGISLSVVKNYIYRDALPRLRERLSRFQFVEFPTHSSSPKREVRHDSAQTHL
jgi:RNA polymerase sigma factor (sigma-70 family)